MTKVLLFILTSFAIFGSMNASEWTFETDADNYPAINSVFNIRDKWQFGDIGLYKGYTVIPRPSHGFALYKDKVWTFYTPELIKANLINPAAAESIDMQNITMYKSLNDLDGNLWLMSNNAIYRYNDSGIYCYYTFRTKDNSVLKPFIVSGLHFNGTYLYCRLGFLNYGSDGYRTSSKFFKYDKQSNEFIEDFDDDSSIPFTCNYEGNIDNYKHILTGSMSIGFDTVQPASPSIAISKMQDTIFMLRSDQILLKCRQDTFSGNLKLVGVDTALYVLEQERLKQINSMGNVGKCLMQIEQNKNIYILVYYNDWLNNANEYTMPKLFKYEPNGKISYSRIPLLPGDTVAAIADDFKVDASGRMAILYRGRGIMHFTPDGAGVEDYPIPGAWIWNLYPNPAKETARIEFHLSSNVRNEAKITISDINGAVIKDITSLIEYDQNRQEATIDFSVSDLSSGNYYILISAGNSKKLRRLVVNK